ncbi:VOC family protein [Luteibacter sp. PPL201]|uniref:VOC family protein n=1 Tax=Luteibacter sahnii TaxID=3021977 RepID=A0ABT6BFV4_9GAMM|nr:VOC family protein [Luteibacter sp. PPL193]MDY1550015.1 VOC family protein [Luteibacter sp. PPL193]
MHDEARDGTPYGRIDHVAIAVRDLEDGIRFFVDLLGFQLMQRRVITGKRTGMVSAELEHNGIKFVLCQGTEPESQVSMLIEKFGPGVAHIALAVDDVEATSAQLRKRGMSFDTSIIRGPGLIQLFSSRDMNSGMSFEFIQRDGEANFSEDNVRALFAQLENSGAY